MAKLYLLLLFLAIAQHARPQDALPDSSNFISYFDKILIKLNLSSQTDRYSLTDKGGTNLDLRTNNGTKVFLSLDYEFIGFSYGFSPEFFPGNNDDDRKGNSSFTNYKLQLFPGQLLQTLSFDKTRGYYIENTGDFIPGWKAGREPYIQIPGLKVVQWSGSTFYIFNRDFSFKNLIYQTQWQKRSSSSFVPALFYDYTRYGLDFFNTRSVQKDFNLRAGMGYFHTFIIRRRFFVAPSLLPSIGLRYSFFHNEENGVATEGRDLYFTRFLDGGLKAGFNATRWVAGLGLNFNLSWYNEDKNRVVQNDKVFGIVYVGYRFHTPKLITRAYEAFMSKLP